MNGTGACITRKDRTILLDCAHPGFEAARIALADYAELVKSPAAYHTYRITPLSLWNAAASGHTAENIISSLKKLSRWGLPAELEQEIGELMSRYGSLELYAHTGIPAILFYVPFNPDCWMNWKRTNPYRRWVCGGTSPGKRLSR